MNSTQHTDFHRDISASLITPSWCQISSQLTAVEEDFPDADNLEKCNRHVPALTLAHQELL